MNQNINKIKEYNQIYSVRFDDNFNVLNLRAVGKKKGDILSTGCIDFLPKQKNLLIEVRVKDNDICDAMHSLIWYTTNFMKDIQDGKQPYIRQLEI